MQRLEETHTNSAIPEQKMCSQCKTFFGSAAFNGLCSKCYKEAQEKLKKQSNEKQSIPEKLEIPITKPTESKKPEVQNDKKVCAICKKRVGYLGFTCKCDLTFCKLHRMPEQHDCQFNFKEEAINKLKNLNPTCSAKKMEYI